MTTTGVFQYSHSAAETEEGGLNSEEKAAEKKRLASAARLESILLKWRDRLSPGLVDDSGQIPGVVIPETALVEDYAGARIVKTAHLDKTVQEERIRRLAGELDQLPEAISELCRAVEAKEVLDTIGQNQVSLPVRNARDLRPEELSLRTSGFLLKEHRSQVTDWNDEAQIVSTYYPEIMGLVKELTGATHVVSDNHIIRESESAGVGGAAAGLGGGAAFSSADSSAALPLLAQLLTHFRVTSRRSGPNMTVARQNAFAAHNDFTDGYGEQIIESLSRKGNDGKGGDGALFFEEALSEAGLTEDLLRSSRIVVVNTWRALNSEPLQRLPLALCDQRSVPRSCLRAAGGIFLAEADPRHEWYFFPGTHKDEVILWKGYDSADDPLRPPLHTGFDDPNTLPGAAERRNIEIRVLCLLPQASSKI